MGRVRIKVYDAFGTKISACIGLNGTHKLLYVLLVRIHGTWHGNKVGKESLSIDGCI